MFRTILVPLDGTPRSEEAIPVLADLAVDRSSAELLVMRVVNPPLATAVAPQGGGPSEIGVAPMYDRALEPLRASALAYLQRVRRRLAMDGWQHVEMLVATGAPADRIAEVADRFSLVVMATRGQSGLRRAIRGSVTDHVVRHTPHSAVLVVCPESEAEARPPPIEVGWGAW